MCLLDETVWHASAIMALGALLIMLINCWQTRVNKKHSAEIQRICEESWGPVKYPYPGGQPFRTSVSTTTTMTGAPCSDCRTDAKCKEEQLCAWAPR